MDAGSSSSSREIKSLLEPSGRFIHRQETMGDVLGWACEKLAIRWNLAHQHVFLSKCTAQKAKQIRVFETQADSTDTLMAKLKRHAKLLDGNGDVPSIR